jgi:hypothetical protein
MTTYSLLFIDANEHIGRSRQIECPTDEQAVDMAAKESGDYRAIQVWDGDRPIVLIGNPRNLGEDLFAPVPSTRQHSTLESDGAPTSD